MPQSSWAADSEGLHWVEIAIGDRELPTLVDLGLADRRGQVGISIEPVLYDHFKQSGFFARHLVHARLDASGRVSITESGEILSRIIEPVSRTPVGPAVRLFAFRGTQGVPNRIGVAFFHHLAGCKV